MCVRGASNNSQCVVYFSAPQLSARVCVCHMAAARLVFHALQIEKYIMKITYFQVLCLSGGDSCHCNQNPIEPYSNCCMYHFKCSKPGLFHLQDEWKKTRVIFNSNCQFFRTNAKLCGYMWILGARVPIAYEIYYQPRNW